MPEDPSPSWQGYSSDLITVEGSLARDGSNLANATSIVMVATGQKMLAGSSGGAPRAGGTNRD